LKYLYLIRHAKAEPFIEGTEDHNRKLVNKGEQRAINLASWLSKKTPIIQELHFSSSIRTIHTAEIVSKALPETLMKFVDSKLYGARNEVLLNYLAFIDDKTHSIGIIGHQPGLKQLAMSLIINFAEGTETVLNKNFSTSNAISIGFNVKRWDQISNRSGILIDYYDSKNNKN
jgi:phosphohistidine phosphatase